MLDDDIVSLIALTLIVNPECREKGINVVISQLTLSLYLMTQCQLQLRYSEASLNQTLDNIVVAYRMHLPYGRNLDRLMLKMAKCKLLMHSKYALYAALF